MPSIDHIFSDATRPLRAVAKATVFFLKVFPMLPSRPIDWVTKKPVIRKVRYPTSFGEAEGDLYLPGGAGPHPGLVICLGVVPFGVEHPQVAVLGNALARSGCAALLYWSPAMRDFRFDPDDIQSIALAYHWLIGQPYIDASRSGLFGTCVGGAFALMAAASPLINEHVSFVGAYAPYSSMWTFAHDIASATRSGDSGREPWQVDQLTRKVFVQGMTAWLEPGEAESLRNVFEKGNSPLDPRSLSAGGQAIYSLLAGPDENGAEIALHNLPPNMQALFPILSPLNYIKDVRTPLIVLLHDRGDPVIPVGESRRLNAALSGRSGVHYTEMQFHHLDPSKGKLPLPRLMRELGKFLGAMYPMFRQIAAP